MAEFRVTIKLDNAAFEGGDLEGETARILQGLADFVRTNYLPTAKALYDVNGNRCGTAELVED